MLKLTWINKIACCRNQFAVFLLFLLVTVANLLFGSKQCYGQPTSNMREDVAAKPASTLKLWVMPATVKVKMQDKSPSVSAQENIDWAAARGEYENAQICFRSSKPVKHIRLVMDGLRGMNASIKARNLNWRQVLYVNCKPIPDNFGHKYAAIPGWYPDPLLSVKEFNLEANITQPIWVQVYVPHKTEAGQVYGSVKIYAGENKLAEVPIQLKIWPIDIDNPGRVNTAFSFFYPYPGCSKSQDVMSAIYGEFTSQLKRRYFKFLGQHRIPADNLYNHTPRPIADYELGFKCGAKCTNIAYAASSVKDIPEMLKRIAPVANYMQSHGQIDRLYLYGFDEKPRSFEPVIRKVFGAAKKQWPGLKTMAVLNWDPPADMPLDIWVQQYQMYNPRAARRWQKAGKQYWWYHCCDPHGKNMNSFIELPTIDIRLMMWLAADKNIDGWLYYAIDLWNYDGKQRHIVKVIGPGPRTDFDPATWKYCNGDGNFIYPGKNGPLSSVRLENLTDALEDWELLIQLRKEIHKHLLQSVSGRDDYVTYLRKKLVQSSLLRNENPKLLEKCRREAARRLIDLRTATKEK